MNTLQIFLSNYCSFLVCSSKIDDTPKRDFYRQLTPIDNDCSKYPKAQLNYSQQQTEGRNYFAYTSDEESQLKTLSCNYADFFFDKEENGHFFVHITKELTDKTKVERTVVATIKRSKDNPEVWDMDYAQDKSKNQVTVQLLYGDDDMLIRWRQSCENGIRSGMIGVAFRNLDAIGRNRQKLDGLIEEISQDLYGDKYPHKKIVLHEIPYDDCAYKPPMKNPYN